MSESPATKAATGLDSSVVVVVGGGSCGSAHFAFRRSLVYTVLRDLFKAYQFKREPVATGKHKQVGKRARQVIFRKK